MSGRSLNGNSFTNNVYVNSMFQEGTAISLTQQSENTKVIVDLDISGLSANTSTNTTDLFVLEEASGGATKKITFGNLTSTLVSLTGTETLQNKSMKLPFKILDTSNNHNYTFAVSELVADRTITLPLLGGNDEFIFKDHTATLTNKTLSTGSTWSGNTLVSTVGGTSFSSYTTGDIIYSSSGNTLSKLAIGSTNQVLKVASGVPTWASDTDTTYTVQAPLNLVGTTISLTNLSGFGNNGDYFKTNGSDTISFSSFTTDANTAIANATSVSTVSNSTARTIGINTANCNINAKKLVLYGVDSGMSSDSVGLEIKGSVSVGGSFTDMNVLEITNRYSAGATSNKPQLKFTDFTGSTGTTLSYVGPDANGNLHYQPTDEIVERADNFGTSKGADINIGSTGYTTNINTKISSTKEGAVNDISLLNGKLYNGNSDSGFRTIYLNLTGYSNFGYGTYTDYGSDVYTFVNNASFKYSSIGSFTSDCIFGLYAANATALTINPAERNWISIGQAVQSAQNFTPQAQLHICNTTSSPDAGDTTLIIESILNTKAPILELMADVGSDTGTSKKGLVYFDVSKPSIDIQVQSTLVSEFRETYVCSKLKHNFLTPVSTGASNAGQTAGNLDTPLYIGTRQWGSQDLYYQMEGYYTPSFDRHWTVFTYDYSSNSRSYFGWSCLNSQLMTVDSAGDLSIAGAYSSSDKRIKENIENADLDEVKSVFDKLELKKYNYNESYREKYDKTKKKVYGFLADDVLATEEVEYCVKRFPISGINDNDGNEMKDILELNKDRLLTLLWGVCKYQQNILDKLTTATTFANFKKSL